MLLEFIKSEPSDLLTEDTGMVKAYFRLLPGNGQIAMNLKKWVVAGMELSGSSTFHYDTERGFFTPLSI